jgi:hypothetical protein
VKAGCIGELRQRLSVGGWRQSRIKKGEFDHYRNLFAEGGGFDIPPAFTAGGTVRPTARMSFSFDVQRILHLRAKSVGNPRLPHLMQA